MSQKGCRVLLVAEGGCCKYFAAEGRRRCLLQMVCLQMCCARAAEKFAAEGSTIIVIRCRRRVLQIFRRGGWPQILTADGLLADVDAQGLREVCRRGPTMMLLLKGCQDWCCKWMLHNLIVFAVGALGCGEQLQQGTSAGRGHVLRGWAGIHLCLWLRPQATTFGHVLG